MKISPTLPAAAAAFGVVALVVPVSAGVPASCAVALAAAMPPPQTPPENPITEPKRALGKILYWDEQLSSDNTMSCGTCHLPEVAGADPRRLRHPGYDGVLMTEDDVFGSPGVVNADPLGNYTPSPLFGMEVQATGRIAPPVIMAAYFDTLFWDGRADGVFKDPQTGGVVVTQHGALENQSMGPPRSPAEMAHAERNWTQICGKLAQARPLALASEVPPDMAAALSADPTYAALFARAFGDPEVRADRIAMAIATYERTLIPDQSPWDRYMDGETSALTAQQVAGMNLMETAACTYCHFPPTFGGNQFNNIGLRPKLEDIGRMSQTGDPADAGRFRATTLRNSGLRSSFMHNGMFTNLTDVLNFYGQFPGAPIRFTDNLDPILVAITFTPADIPALADFVGNALTDPRVAQGLFPFDRPTLFSERAGDYIQVVAGTGVAGTAGVRPGMIANSPPMLGTPELRLGLKYAYAGSQARLNVSSRPPAGPRLVPERTIGPVTVAGPGPGQGYATIPLALDPAEYAGGAQIFVQWVVEDPGAADGLAASEVVRLVVFCPSGECPPSCNTDYNQDGGGDNADVVDIANDIASGTQSYPPNSPDFNRDGGADNADVVDIANTIAGGPCP